MWTIISNFRNVLKVPWSRGTHIFLRSGYQTAGGSELGSPCTNCLEFGCVAWQTRTWYVFVYRSRLFLNTFWRPFSPSLRLFFEQRFEWLLLYLKYIFIMVNAATLSRWNCEDASLRCEFSQQPFCVNWNSSALRVQYSRSLCLHFLAVLIFYRFNCVHQLGFVGWTKHIR